MSEEILFRFATPSDADRLLRWRNDPVTREAAFSSDEVTLEEHRAWLARTLKNPQRLLLIGMTRSFAALCQVRFDRSDDGRSAEISITIAPEARGKGYGSSAIAGAVGAYLANFDVKHIIARVKPSNPTSRRVFERAGFVLAETHSDHLEYHRCRSEPSSAR